MSAKNAQGMVDERRLRPIYDLLENANNKKAIQEADKVLKKQPNLLCAKALKALALLRLGKEGESLEILDSIRKEKPSDDATLQGMTMCYSDLNRHDQICELYEAAKLAQPKNEEIIINLFSAYVRVGDFKNQQMTALALTKVRSKGQYYFWMAMSILLQALSVDELTEYCMPPLCDFKEPYIGGEKREENLTRLRFVEKVIDKMIQEDKIESPGEALLCPIAPEALGNYAKAIEVLDSISTKTKIPLSMVNKKKVELYIKLNQWDKANILLKKLLSDEPDSWVLVLYYLESVKKTMEKSINEIGVDSSFEKANNFFKLLIEDNKDNKKRGPFLAKLELYKRWLLSETKGIEVADYASEFCKYVKEWGTLDCCGRDLAPYLPHLPRSELVKLLNLVWLEVGLSKKATPSSPKQLALHLTNLELVRASNLFLSLSPEDTSTLISYLISCFLSTKDMTKQSDRYILICVHYLYDAYLSTDSADYLYEALVLLHLGLNFNPNHKQFKLCLVKLYHCLGAAIPAHDAFTALDVKHMQVDSLGYLHVWPTLHSGIFTIAFELLTASLRFFNTNYKDSLGQVIYAYKYDAFTKIPEFIGIKDCLNNSLQYRLVRVEHALMQLLRPNQLTQIRKLLSEIDNASVFKDIDWSEIYDNRDLNVFWYMDGENKRLSKSDVDDSLGRELVLLKARSLIGRWVGAAVNTRCKESGRENGDDTGYESGASEGSGGMEEVAKEIEAMLATGAPIGRCLVFSDPPPSRLDAMFSILYFQPLLYEARLLTAMFGDNADPEKAQYYLNLIYIYFHEMCEYMSKVRRDPCSRGSLLTTATLFSELVSLTSVLVRVLESLLTPSSDKKNKKKRDSQEESMCWKEEITGDLRRCVVSHMDEVIVILRREQKAWSEKPVSPPLASINLEPHLMEHNCVLQTCATEVTTSITKSHSSSLMAIVSILTDHLHLFS